MVNHDQLFADLTKFGIRRGVDSVDLTGVLIEGLNYH